MRSEHEVNVFELSSRISRNLRGNIHVILAIVALLGPGSVYHACIAAIVNSNRPTAYSSQYLIVCLYFLTAVALQLHTVPAIAATTYISPVDGARTSAMMRAWSRVGLRMALCAQLLASQLQASTLGVALCVAQLALMPQAVPVTATGPSIIMHIPG